MMTNHYHQHYNSDASVPDEIAVPFAILIFTGIALFSLYNLLMYLEGWRSFEAPYNYISAFYYYTLTVPVSFAKVVWHQVVVEGFTLYPNVNYVLGFLAEFIYTMIIGTIIYIIALLISKITNGRKRNIVFYFLIPALCALVWFVLGNISSWLLAI